jgi:uncharacterized protein (DUF433 family)
VGLQDFGRLWRRDGVAGGQVCFDQTGVIVTFIAELFAAGESIDSLAKQYGLDRRDIEAGVRLVVHGACGRTGIRRGVERRMEDRIPLLTDSRKSTDAVDPHVRSSSD